MMNKIITAAWMFMYVFGSINLVSADTQIDSRLQKNLYIIFDGSGSMNSSKCSGKLRKIDVAKEALITFLSTVPDDYNCGLFLFDKKGAREINPLSTLDRQQLIGKIKAIQAGGSTPLCNSIDEAKKSILKQKKNQLGYGEYTLLIVTDGEANNQSRLPDHVRPVADEGIVIQVIGFCLGKTHSLKKNVHKYREANSPEELRTALQDVLGEADEFTDLSAFEYLSIDEPLEDSTSSSRPTRSGTKKKPALLANVVSIIIIAFLIFIVFRIVKRKKK